MGVFGEAIYGHIGQYKAKVYNAQYLPTADHSVQLAPAQGLTEQDVINQMFGSASIGPQNDSSVVLSLNTGMKGWSWAVRAARQTNSTVSAGFCHAVHCQTELASLYQIDRLIYFPYIPDGDYCVSLLRDSNAFNAPSRWENNIQAVEVVRETDNQILGAPLRISSDLMKRLTSYIISQVSINAKQYLYIRVPDQAPYEPYCLAALHDILSMIPVGLRAGISAATNPDPKEEGRYGIIFQRASFPARHASDINLHVNAPYPFLNQLYISEPIQKLMYEIVDYPVLIEKCFRTMEQEVFRNDIPRNHISYENYYRISEIQKDQERPGYLEECNQLLISTKEPTLQKVLDRVILEEYKTSEDLEAAILRDPLFASVNSFKELSAYLQQRAAIFSFLRQRGISYSALFIYRHLQRLASDAGIGNDIDFYSMIVNEKSDLEGLEKADRDRFIESAHESAWKYYSVMRSRDRDGWDTQTAMNQYKRLCELDRIADPSFRPPVSEVNWNNGQERQILLKQFRETMSPEAASGILEGIPDYGLFDWSENYLTPESGELIGFVIDWMRNAAAVKLDSQAAWDQIIQIENFTVVFDRFFQRQKKVFPSGYDGEKKYWENYRNTLYIRAVDYMDTPTASGQMLSKVIDLVRHRIPERADECIWQIEDMLAEKIVNDTIPHKNRQGIYNAAAAGRIVPSLQQAYCGWVETLLQQDELSEDILTNLYESVRNPDPQLQESYYYWSNQTLIIKDLNRKMRASRSLVKYLHTILNSGRYMQEDRISQSRAVMWQQLEEQEKTISAFAASLSYITGIPADVFMEDPKYRPKNQIIREELQKLVSKYGMGLYLDPNLSISELYDNVLRYKNWTGKRTLTVYTRNNIKFLPMNEQTDVSGQKIYSYNLTTEDLLTALNGLIMILDEADYRSSNTAEEVDLRQVLSTLKKKEKAMKLLEGAGIIENNSELVSKLSGRGYRFKGAGGGKKGLPIKQIAVIGGTAFLALILGLLIGRFLLPGGGSKSTPEEISTTAKTTIEEDTGTGDSAKEGPGEGKSIEEESAEEKSDEAGTGEEKSTEAGTGEEKSAEAETGEEKSTEDGSTVPENLPAFVLPDGENDPYMEVALKMADQLYGDAHENAVIIPGAALASKSSTETDKYLVMKLCKMRLEDDGTLASTGETKMGYAVVKRNSEGNTDISVSQDDSRFWLPMEDAPKDQIFKQYYDEVGGDTLVDESLKSNIGKYVKQREAEGIEISKVRLGQDEYEINEDGSLALVKQN